MREISVRIAGVDYAVASKTIGQNRQWRDKLAAEVEPIIDAMGDLKSVELSDFGTMTVLARTVKDTVMHSSDTILNLLCEYAPAIAADRTRIEDEAYDDEVFVAFGKILAVVFPLGSLVKGLTGPSPNGRVETTTSKSSSEPSMVVTRTS